MPGSVGVQAKLPVDPIDTRAAGRADQTEIQNGGGKVKVGGGCREGQCCVFFYRFAADACQPGTL